MKMMRFPNKYVIKYFIAVMLTLFLSHSLVAKDDSLKTSSNRKLYFTSEISYGRMIPFSREEHHYINNECYDVDWTIKQKSTNSFNFSVGASFMFNKFISCGLNFGYQQLNINYSGSGKNEQLCVDYGIPYSPPIYSAGIVKAHIPFMGIIISIHARGVIIKNGINVSPFRYTEESRKNIYNGGPEYLYSGPLEKTREKYFSSLHMIGYEFLDGKIAVLAGMYFFYDKLINDWNYMKTTSPWKVYLPTISLNIKI